MRTKVLIFQAIFFLLFASACENMQQSDSTDVYGFSFYGLKPVAAGKIDYDNQKITLSVPYDTDLAHLVPSILVHPNASVSPLSGLENDFTNPVLYTVTAEDGTKREYTVTVMRQEADYVLDFEAYVLGNSGYFTGPDNSVNPVTENIYGFDCQLYYGYLNEKGTKFSNVYNSTWMAWSGFAISSLHDKLTPGFANEGSVYAAGGAEGSKQFAIAYAPDYASAPVQLIFPIVKKVVSVQLANSTYTYLSLKNGDQFNAPFKEGDFLKVTLKGFNAMNEPTGMIEYYLADYREGKRILADDWKILDISALGTVARIEFSMQSSSPGAPTYFCLDNLRAMNVSLELR